MRDSGAVQALIARDVDFAMTPGDQQLVACQRGQRLVSVMSIRARNSINVVMHCG